MVRIVLLILMKFILGAEAGASFSWSAKWQNKSWKQQIPEASDAIMMGFMAMEGYRSLGFNPAFYWQALVFIVSTSIIYAGIQSATWLFLQWEGHNNHDTDRGSSTKPVVDWLAHKFGWKLGDEGYSWVAATVKGTIITLPMGGIGGIFFALGYEIGSHAEGRVNKWFNPHIISEGLSFVGVGIYALIFLEVCKHL